jgi:trimethylamine corrinoid protein
MSAELFSKIIDAVANIDDEAIVSLATEALDAGNDPVTVIQEAYTPGIKRLGDLYDTGEIFLPEMFIAATAVKEALAILKNEIPKGEMKFKGTLVIGTVEGDVHDIGKDLVAMMISTQGVDVYNVGADTPVDVFIDKAIEVNANIIGTSTLLTMTVNEIEKLVSTLKKRGLRDRFKIICGGAAMSEELAETLGADAFAEDAQEATVLIGKLLSEMS